MTGLIIPLLAAAGYLALKKTNKAKRRTYYATGALLSLGLTNFEINTEDDGGGVLKIPSKVETKGVKKMKRVNPGDAATGSTFNVKGEGSFKIGSINGGLRGDSFSSKNNFRDSIINISTGNKENRDPNNRYYPEILEGSNKRIKLDHNFISLNPHNDTSFAAINFGGGVVAGDNAKANVKSEEVVDQPSVIERVEYVDRVINRVTEVPVYVRQEAEEAPEVEERGFDFDYSEAESDDEEEEEVVFEATYKEPLREPNLLLIPKEDSPRGMPLLRERKLVRVDSLRALTQAESESLSKRGPESLIIKETKKLSEEHLRGRDTILTAIDPMHFPHDMSVVLRQGSKSYLDISKGFDEENKLASLTKSESLNFKDYKSEYVAQQSASLDEVYSTKEKFKDSRVLRMIDKLTGYKKVSAPSTEFLVRQQAFKNYLPPVEQVDELWGIANRDNADNANEVVRSIDNQINYKRQSMKLIEKLPQLHPNLKFNDETKDQPTYNTRGTRSLRSSGLDRMDM